MTKHVKYAIEKVEKLLEVVARIMPITSAFCCVGACGRGNRPINANRYNGGDTKQNL